MRDPPSLAEVLPSFCTGHKDVPYRRAMEVVPLAHITSVYVLVDWDNLERSFPGRNVAEDVAYQLRERVVSVCDGRFPAAREVEVRCYSGWQEASGRPTRVGLAVRPKIEQLSGRVRGYPIRLVCVDGMVVQGAPPVFAHLAGPRDCRCGASAQLYEQKMVDTIIVADASALAEYEGTGIVVVGDDIDLAPGVVMAGTQRAFLTNRPSASSEVIWLRRGQSTRQTRAVSAVASIEDW